MAAGHTSRAGTPAMQVLSPSDQGLAKVANLDGNRYIRLPSLVLKILGHQITPRS